MGTEPQVAGWVLTGFQVWVALWAWAGLVALHALWRVLHGPETDPVRPSGPAA
jgi:hypothetical protein